MWVAVHWSTARSKYGSTNEKNQTRFSNSNVPVGVFLLKPPSRLKTFSPRSHVSRTMPRRVRPWYGEHLFRKSMVLGSTTHSAESSKTQMSASNPGTRSPFWRSSPTCAAVLAQHRRTMSWRARLVLVSSGAEVRPFRRLSSVHRIGRPRPTEEIPPQAEEKLPWFFSMAASPLEVQLPGIWEGRSFRSGVHGEWSDTTVLMTPSSAWRSNSAQRASWLSCERIGGQHLWRVSPSRISSAARDR